MEQQNVHKKFNDRQNQVRLFIIEFTVNEGRAFNLEADKSLVEERYKDSETDSGDGQEHHAHIRHRGAYLRCACRGCEQDGFDGAATGSA